MKFSIILPVRNGGEYVKECINSILAQTLNNFNLVVLDNSSSDGTREWIAGLNDPRIKIISSNESLSIEQNWKRVLDVEKNEYMTLIGHDDLLHPEFLNEMDQLIQKYPTASLYTSQFNFIDDKGAVIRPSKPIAEKEDASLFLKKILENEADIMGTGFVMRSEDYDRIGGIPMYPNLLFADIELWFELTRISYKVASDKTLFAFRIHRSTTSISRDTTIQDGFEKVIYFFAGLMKVPEYRQVLQEHSIPFIRYNCRGLAHRLLRTHKDKRGKLSVKSFLSKCKLYADMLVPGNAYHPESDSSVRLF